MLLVRLHHNLHPRQGVEGGLAQLARAPALQAGGQEFEPPHLHQFGLIAQVVRARA